MKSRYDYDIYEEIPGQGFAMVMRQSTKTGDACIFVKDGYSEKEVAHITSEPGEKHRFVIDDSDTAYIASGSGIKELKVDLKTGQVTPIIAD